MRPSSSLYPSTSSILLAACIYLSASIHNSQFALAFAPPTRLSYTVPPLQRSSNHRLSAVALPNSVTLPNPFKKLPWIAAKEQQRQKRRFQQERAKLHRELGIPPEASYEEIVAATDRLIAMNAGDLKKKVQIEIAKDKILQIRLNERLAGLAEIDSAAMKQSVFEKEGADEDDVRSKVKKDKENEPQAPAWTRGLLVKPDRAHAISQLRLWGIMTAIGVALPPSQDYIGRFAWLVCVAQLTFRGMPKEEQESGGMAMNFNAGGKGGHRKVAFAIGFGTWVVGSFVVYTLMPTWAKGQRWTGSVAFTMMNLIFGLVSSYLQPYKG